MNGERRPGRPTGTFGGCRWPPRAAPGRPSTTRRTTCSRPSTSKLEAIELYQQYEDDSRGDAQSLFQEMAEQDRRYSERILAMLRTRFATRDTGDTT